MACCSTSAAVCLWRWIHGLRWVLDDGAWDACCFSTSSASTHFPISVVCLWSRASSRPTTPSRARIVCLEPGARSLEPGIFLVQYRSLSTSIDTTPHGIFRLRAMALRSACWSARRSSTSTWDRGPKELDSPKRSRRRVRTSKPPLLLFESRALLAEPPAFSAHNPLTAMRFHLLGIAALLCRASAFLEPQARAMTAMRGGEVAEGGQPPMAPYWLIRAAASQSILIYSLDVLRQMFASHVDDTDSLSRVVDDVLPQLRGAPDSELTPVQLSLKKLDEDFSNGMELRRFIDAPQCAVNLAEASNGAKTIFVVFRGAKDVVDWLYDGEVHLAPYRDGNCPALDRVRVHEGLLRELRRVVPSKRPQVEEQSLEDELLWEVDRLLGEHPNANIVVTGHSLGGGLSHLFGVSLANAQGYPAIQARSRRIDVISLASPPAGNGQWEKLNKRLVEDEKLRITRVANKNDIVTIMPIRPIGMFGRALALMLGAAFGFGDGLGLLNGVPGAITNGFIVAAVASLAIGALYYMALPYSHVGTTVNLLDDGGDVSVFPSDALAFSIIWSPAYDAVEHSSETYYKRILAARKSILKVQRLGIRGGRRQRKRGQQASRCNPAEVAFKVLLLTSAGTEYPGEQYFGNQ